MSDGDGDLAVYFDDDDEPPRAPRRRRRMGEVLKQMGDSARARPGLESMRTELQAREQPHAADATRGGQSKGEKLGFGATSGKGG